MKFFGLQFIRDIPDDDLWRYFPRQTETVYEKLVQFHNFMFQKLSSGQHETESIFLLRTKHLLLKFATNGIILFKDEGFGRKMWKSQMEKTIDKNVEIVQTILDKNFTECKLDEQIYLRCMKHIFGKDLIRGLMDSTKEGRVKLFQSIFKLDSNVIQRLLQIIPSK